MTQVQEKSNSTLTDAESQHVPVQTELSDTQTSQAIVHDRFTKNEKWFIVCLTAAVGLFSPLTANIYFPAIPTLSQAFHKPTELINLTVTMYMVLQGIAPMVWGPLSDHVGRRPTSAGCMIILALSCVGLALVPTNAFWLLMLLRCLQAAGSASTIAIGAGVVGDISSRAERGGFFGVFTLGPMIGPTIGPVIGGALSDHLGWRSIFWFLCISSSVCLLMIILFQPETLKILYETGRGQTPFVHLPLVPIIGRNRPNPIDTTAPTSHKASRNPFRIFLNVDVDILLVISALACAVFYGVIASISTLFTQTYPFLSETDIGLCFLAIGGGMTVGSMATGRVLDHEYQHFKRRAEKENTEKGSESSVDTNKEENFPLEQARLRMVPIYALTMSIACVGYGWCLSRKTQLACPLVLHFIIGYCGISIMNTTNTLMMDLVPTQSSSVTACNNLIRCTSSAVLVSVIDLIIAAIKVGWTYVLIGCLTLLILPLVMLSLKLGPRWRVKRQNALASSAS